MLPSSSPPFPSMPSHQKCFSEFSEAQFLQSIEPGVNCRWLRDAAFSNNSFYEPGFISESDLLAPLRSHAFPKEGHGRFAPFFEFVYISYMNTTAGDCIPRFIETQEIPNSTTWMYLTSIHLFTDWKTPKGMRISSFFLERTLEKLIKVDDAMLFSSLKQFLGWLLHIVEGHTPRRPYFIALSLLILGRISGSTDTEERFLKKLLDSALQTHYLWTITDSRPCSQSWPKLFGEVCQRFPTDLHDLQGYLPTPDPYL